MHVLYYSISILLLALGLTYGGHFDGGSIRWIPVTKNASASPVEIMIIQTYTYTFSTVNCTVGALIDLRGSFGFNFSLWCTLNCDALLATYDAPPILSYCTGSNTALDLAFTQRIDVVNITANDSFSISNGIPNNVNKGYYRTLALSAGGNDTKAQWNITATIDIRPRSDNGLINTPPLANIMSPYGIPYNISTQIVIRTMDVDSDNVRCRWGNSTVECGDVCFPRTIPSSAILSSDCILTITGLKVGDWYCAPIQVEDFLNENTTQALSSVPLQFLIYVYQPMNCSSPTLTSSISCIGVQVGIPYTFTLTVINHCGSSSNISSIVIQTFPGIVQGPLNQVTPNPNTTIYEMDITYTALSSQVGLQAICATALDNNNIPSNQYCITFIVDSTTVPLCPGNKTTVTTSTITTSIITTESVTTISSTTTTKALTTAAEITSAVPMNNVTSMKYLSSSQSQITSQSINTTSSLLSSSTSSSSTSKPTSINWSLIGALAGLMALLTLFCCCCCYYFFWGPALRHHRLQQKTKHKREWPTINGNTHKSTNLSQLHKPYQIRHIDSKSTSSAARLIRHSKPQFSSCTNSRIIRLTPQLEQPFHRIHSSVYKKERERKITPLPLSNLSSSTDTDRNNSMKSTEMTHRLVSRSERQPTVRHVSRCELPEKTRINIPSNVSSTKMNTRSSSQNTVQVHRVRSNNTTSITNNQVAKHKMKHFRRYNSVTVTRIST